MISSVSLSSVTASTRQSEPVVGYTHVKDLGSATYERFAASGRKELTTAEMDAIDKETIDLRMAIYGFIMEGNADPLTAASEAVAKMAVQAFDSRAAALESAFSSVDLMFRATTAAQASLNNIAAANSVRATANASQLADINHVVGKENAYLGQVNGRLNVTQALLERDFTVTGTLLERGKDGSVKLGAFDLTHKTFGRLLSVDGDGNVTLYDQAGEAMDAAAYVDALFGGGGLFGRVGDARPGVVDRTM